jgi:hypothetical protein
MFEFDILEMDNNLQVIKTDVKTVYNTDDCEKLQNWVVKDVKKEKRQDCPQMSSPLVIKQKGSGKTIPNSLGYFYSYGNNVYFNPTNVGLLSSGFSNGHGVGVSVINFNKVVIAFTARKIIKSNWINQKDEYLVPNEEHEQFEQFKYNSLVYSLFHIHSFQSSLRQVEYKDKLWDIKNEFFWMSKDRMKELADENGYDNLYNDARTSSERHVYNLLFGEERIYDKLSPDAKLVLDKATELVEKSMELRQVMANDENHLDSWDAGYAQLKLIWKDYFQEDFKEFRQLYKNLEDRMRPLVYELGFLIK